MLRVTTPPLPRDRAKSPTRSPEHRTATIVRDLSEWRLSAEAGVVAGHLAALTRGTPRMDLWASGFGLGDQGSSPAAPTAAANDGSGLAQAQAVSVTDLAIQCSVSLTLSDNSFARSIIAAGSANTDLCRAFGWEGAMNGTTPSAVWLTEYTGVYRVTCSPIS